MLLLSYLMASSISYPSFKAITCKTRRSMPMVVGTILILVMTVMNWEWMPAILFVTYMIYGIARPWISRRWRAEIEQEEESFATPESSRKPDDDQGFLEADSQS